MTLSATTDTDSEDALLRIPKAFTEHQLLGTQLLTAGTQDKETAFVFTELKGRMWKGHLQLILI